VGGRRWRQRRRRRRRRWWPPSRRRLPRRRRRRRRGWCFVPMHRQALVDEELRPVAAASVRPFTLGVAARVCVCRPPLAAGRRVTRFPTGRRELWAAAAVLRSTRRRQSLGCRGGCHGDGLAAVDHPSRPRPWSSRRLGRATCAGAATPDRTNAMHPRGRHRREDTIVSSSAYQVLEPTPGQTVRRGEASRLASRRHHER